MGTKEKRTGLGEALFSGVQQRVLGVLFANHERSFYGNELLRLAKTGRGALQRELDGLVRAGLVMQRAIGKQKHYQANPESPIFSELRSIVVKTFGVADVLRQALLPFADRIKAAFIYGSVAKGTDTATSDIDLFVISDTLSYQDIFEAVQEAENNLARKVNPTIYSARELARKRAQKNSFVVRVLQRPKIFLIGSDGDLG